MNNISLISLGLITSILLSTTGAAAKVEKPLVAYVDDDGVQAKALGIKDYYAEIGSGRQAVAKGGKVYVLPGNYNGSYITSSVQLIAVDANGKVVNPKNDPNNTSWPVIINNPATPNGFRILGADDVIIRGFYIKNIKDNGIYVQGVTDYDAKGTFMVKKVSERIVLAGNRIENTGMDGIKGYAVNNVRVVGNFIANTSQTKHGMEQAIDFMDSGNVRIARNLVARNKIGLVAKGGSSNITVIGNNFAGPFEWTAISSEPAGEKYYAWHALNNTAPYQVKNLLVVNNSISDGYVKSSGDAIVSGGCQNCSYIDNKAVHGLKLGKARGNEVAKNICIKNSGNLKNEGGMKYTTDKCPTSWPAAKVALTPRGMDIVPVN